MKALVVDDDRVLADLIAFALRRQGFEVIQAGDGKTALQRWRDESPDIILLDVNLPRSAPPLDGFAICRQIRESSNTPIILLTVRGDEEDIIQGLHDGADDYVTKPFSPRQLVARVQAVLRRVGQVTPSTSLQVGDLDLDVSRRTVRISGGEPISLTALESRLLENFMLQPGHILPIASLIDHIWGPGAGTREMLRQLVHRLRSKIEQSPDRYIETVPGLGYGLRSPD